MPEHRELLSSTPFPSNPIAQEDFLNYRSFLDAGNVPHLPPKGAVVPFEARDESHVNPPTEARPGVLVETPTEPAEGTSVTTTFTTEESANKAVEAFLQQTTNPLAYVTTQVEVVTLEKRIVTVTTHEPPEKQEEQEEKLSMSEQHVVSCLLI
ncbi:unnamed protein product [Haemonchus placei]|uniref:Aggrecan core protein n=1 Tax=Haemonchus placei TaxID=6290 RepID=A0A0N4WS45_HAEPC|nr:unnamed protein product [Haemonchus placei]